MILCNHEIGREEVYDSIDCILSDDPHDHLSYTEEFLNSLTPTRMPPHKMRFKKGAVIMLLRNLMPSNGLCNGTRLIVTKLQCNVIEAEMIGKNWLKRNSFNSENTAHPIRQ
ncbi:hypothetical protein AVEN_206392-1 [Araneus ventricosus]|uniref:DNA helicase Pif1-like 2B domain-containing protein n=1 Tax=Araneus ventricosus TaxID=182803 RepID=A0A4Y2EN17_ARAVE|nr:hypothetical protein AVEN_206392-1 [Araneus ventricosus]